MGASEFPYFAMCVVLFPVYLFSSQVLGESSEVLAKTLRKLNIKVSKDELRYALD